MYLKKIVIALLCMLCALNVVAGQHIEPELPGRQIVPLNANWQFYFTYNFERNIQKETVSLPHTWNAEEVLKGVADYKRTSAIYEHKLQVPAAWSGKRLFLSFEGVNNVATVLINRKMVTEHHGGYTAFTVEITDNLKVGDNTVTVMVSNAYRPDIIPLHGDFNLYGGIHRPVSLIITDKNCISPLDFGSSGIYLDQQQVSEASAQVTVRTKLSLAGSKDLSLKTVILDDKGNIVAAHTGSLEGMPQDFKQILKIKGPHLWNGKADPYLYQVEVALLKNGKLIDKVNEQLGLRYFRVDPDKGFFLNGKYLDLYGPGYHEDVSGKGSALSEEDLIADMELVKELGATAVRLTHYPHSKSFYDLCDKNGIILWSEIPLVGPGGYTGTGYFDSNALKNNIKQVLTELIRQYYNHPSICFWGMFNELKLDYDDPRPFIKEINALTKKEDPGRLTTLASNLGSAEFTDLTDLMGWNQYFGWYGGSFGQVGQWADKTHEALPAKAISISEYGAGASPFKHTEDLEKPNPGGRFHPEEWQTAFHEAHWAELKKRPFIWGKFIWVLADFGSSIRTEGDKDGINDKGLVTYDRKIKKDAFYFYKANWNPEPMLYIAERRNTERRKPSATVKVFTNVPAAELWINGRLLGKKVKNEQNTILWENLTLSPGKNRIVVKTKVKGKILEDHCIWNQM